MSFPYTPKLQDEKIVSLQTRYEYLKLLRLRHQQWLSSAENAMIEGMHVEIAELIEQTAERYHHLLDALQHRDIELSPWTSSVSGPCGYKEYLIEIRYSLAG